MQKKKKTINLYSFNQSLYIASNHNQRKQDEEEV